MCFRVFYIMKKTVTLNLAPPYKPAIVKLPNKGDQGNPPLYNNYPYTVCFSDSRYTDPC